ncbi:hypothetical protein ACIBO5_29255 [Nonomuraea angiospora]
MSAREVVRAYHDARFRGAIEEAAALVGEPFSFRSPFISSADPAAIR